MSVRSELEIEISRADEACRDLLSGNRPPRAWKHLYERAQVFTPEAPWYRRPRGWTLHRPRDGAYTYVTEDGARCAVYVVRFLCGGHTFWSSRIQTPAQFETTGRIACTKCAPDAPRPIIVQRERIATAHRAGGMG